MVQFPSTGTMRIAGGGDVSFEVYSEGERQPDLDAQRTSRSTRNGNIKSQEAARNIENIEVKYHA